jgi:tetratricopeptide (TPR) repeat protein
MSAPSTTQPRVPAQESLTADGRNHLLADLATKDCLAEVLARQGKRAEGEALLRDALEQRKTILGQTISDPDVRRTMNNLAGTLNDGDEALVLFRQVFEGDKADLGLEHAYTIISLNNIGQFLSHQGNHAEAEVTMRQVVALGQAVHGPYHHETVAYMDNLREILIKNGKTDEAQNMLDERPKLHQTMAKKQTEDGEQETASRKELEESKDDTVKASVMRSLADVLEKRGQYVEAESMLRDSISLAQNLPNRSEVDLQSSQRGLGVLLSRQGKYREAEEVFRGLLEPPSS